ncbi:MAG TPA: hypothetical protein PK767_10170 [Clostridiales bacterium]|nr:hypothetical protein [Clostridiales bacterium]HPP36590.1 hypothetical protein [Clostridiales bacterium]
MKIKIDAGGHRFNISLPIGIIMNRFTARIAESCMKKYVSISDVSFTGEQLVTLFRALKQAGKVFPGLVLVDVKTADNQRVLIIL